MILLSHPIALFTGLLYLLITMKLIGVFRQSSSINIRIRRFLLLAIFTLILAPFLISFFWDKLFPSLVMFMLPSVMTAIFLAFPSIYKTPTIDLQEPKVRKVFADKHRIRLQIPIDQNDPILTEHKTPFRRFSAEHAEILYLLLDEHMQKLNDRTKQLAYITSWKANHSRLTENSVGRYACRRLCRLRA